MRNIGDGQRSRGLVSRSAWSSFRAISSYLRIVSSGASTVARSAVSAASSVVERDNDSAHDQVLWAGFDKLEEAEHDYRRVLLLGYRSGFQVLDVEEANNVHYLVSRYDGPVSFLQMLPNPLKSKRSGDKFSDSRPLLVLCADSFSDDGNIPNYNEPGSGGFFPTVVRFYSLKAKTYVHKVKFRSVIYSVRCSSRIVAISQAAQIHCFDAATLEKEYNILTSPIPSGFGSVGYCPLAVGPRWLAYSGTPVAISNAGRVSPQDLAPSTTFPGFALNGSLVAQYAKESSRQLAAGIVTLGDMGYKKLSRYCSEILPDTYSSLQSGVWKGKGTVNGHLTDADSIGMVIVRDIMSKNIISQFRAHKSPISALCFDPNGTLLVTASVQGHNINVFRIFPGLSGSSSACDVVVSSTHLYRLQRGVTNAVIQDISFSNDSNWIMISSSKGTSHLFEINSSGAFQNLDPHDTNSIAKNIGLGVTTNASLRWPPSVNSRMSNQQSFCTYGLPITLSVASRIRNGNNGWIGTVSGAAAAATGRSNPLSAAIASSFFCSQENKDYHANGSSLRTKCHLLVFSPSGCMVEYALRTVACHDSQVDGSSNGSESVSETEERLQVEAIQKWTIYQKQTRRERDDNIEVYGENGSLDCIKICPEELNTRNYALRNSSEAATNEKQHLYISEMELQTCNACASLWAKPEICFQSMVSGHIKLDGGEVEIERIRAHTIEAKSKSLVPVYDYLQTPSFHRPS